MDRLFIVVYAFMATTLGLKGLVKEVFAVIFGFWLESSKKRNINLSGRKNEAIGLIKKSEL